MSAPAAEKTEREKTEYVVLRGDHDQWTSVGTYEGANAEAAIRAHIGRNPVDGQEFVTEGAGTYVAVPARSWKPVTVKTETKTVLTLS